MPPSEFFNFCLDGRVTIGRKQFKFQCHGEGKGRFPLTSAGFGSGRSHREGRPSHPVLHLKVRSPKVRPGPGVRLGPGPPPSRWSRGGVRGSLGGPGYFRGPAEGPPGGRPQTRREARRWRSSAAGPLLQVDPGRPEASAAGPLLQVNPGRPEVSASRPRRSASQEGFGRGPGREQAGTGADRGGPGARDRPRPRTLASPPQSPAPPPDRPEPPQRRRRPPRRRLALRPVPRSEPQLRAGCRRREYRPPPRPLGPDPRRRRGRGLWALVEKFHDH